MTEKQVADQVLLNGKHLSSVIRKGHGLLVRESNGETHDMIFKDAASATKILEELHYCMDTGRTWKLQGVSDPKHKPK